MTGTEHYSTLELDPIQNNSNERHEEDSRVGPEVWRDAPGRHLEAQYLHPVTLPPEYKAGDVQVPQVQETICGISRRRFYIVLSIAVLIVIGAIAGGVGGGLAASHRSTTTHANTTNANTSSIQILSTSKLAATTMFSIHNTDSQSIRYVAFQDAQGALIVRKYDSLAGNWTTINMTTYFATSTTPVKIMPGTPLAATSCNSWNCKNSAIYFLNANNSMGSVVDRPATTPVFWEYQPIENSSATWNGSQLAAAYKNSNKPNTVGSFDVAYQSSDGAITVVNLQDSTSTEVIATRFATSNTSLALMSQYNENRTFLSDLTILAELNSELYSGREQLRYYNQDADSWADNSK